MALHGTTHVGRDDIQASEISTGGSGNDSVTIEDTANNSEIARFDEGGGTQLGSNGPINLGDPASPADNAGEIGIGGTLQLGNYFVTIQRNSNDLVLEGYSGINMYSTNTNQNLLQAEDNGNVLFPNGEIRTSAVNATTYRNSATDGWAGMDWEGSNNDSIRWECSTGTRALGIKNKGTGAFLFNVSPGGTVKIPEGGPNGTGNLNFANTRIYEDANGEIVAEDSAGNTTVLS